MWKTMVFHSASFLLSRGRFHRVLREIMRAQWWDRERILDLQWRKFQRLLNHSYNYVPYYRCLFERLGITPRDIRSYEDLVMIPILTKEDINRNRELLRARNYREGEFIEDHTGGSTGEPLTFYRDRRFTGVNYAHQIRNLSWCGWREGESLAYLWGSPIELADQQRLLRRVRSDLHNEVWFDAFHLTEEDMRLFAERLRRLKPRVLSGYATALRIFAEWIQQEGVELFMPAVVSTAELLDVETRRLLEVTFQCEVFDRFGCREVGNSAHECCAHEGLHINAEHVLIESVDHEGQHVEYGKPGELLYTNLDNFAFPLIRYKVGDVGVLSDKACSCGRGLPMLNDVQGRISDIIRTPRGVMVHGEFFSHLFYGTDGIRRFQVYQRRPSAIDIRLVVKEGKEISQEWEVAVAQRIRDFVGDDLEISFSVVPEIPRSPSGKYRFVISDLEE